MPDPTTPPEPDSPPYALEDQVGFLLRLANQRHTAIFQSLAPHGLTATQFAALVRLAELGACSQNELGRRTAMDVATIKGVVDRLRKKGFVQVETDPNDKRRTMLSIAPEFADIAAELHKAGRRITADTLEPLSPEDRAIFLRLLAKMGGS